eukprot:8703958-Alexandrium_andersonii.AAC.1
MCIRDRFPPFPHIAHPSMSSAGGKCLRNGLAAMRLQHAAFAAAQHGYASYAAQRCAAQH